MPPNFRLATLDSPSWPLRFAPDPMRVHPIEGQDRVVLLKPLITSPLIEVGEYSYYDDPEHAVEFQTRNVTHHYGPDRLIIGSFCAIAAGATFIMNGANHRMNGPSTYPFPIMGAPWAAHIDLITDLPSRGDTNVGNDVWIGGNATIMPASKLDTERSSRPLRSSRGMFRPTRSWAAIRPR